MTIADLHVVMQSRFPSEVMSFYDSVDIRHD